GGPELMQEVGVRFHVGAWRGALGGWRALVEHGHGLRVEEGRLYRALLAVFHSRAAVRAFSMLHPDWAVRLARSTSKGSRAMRSSDGGAGLRQVAHARLAAERETELVVYAHSHVPALEKAPGGGVYANAGSWLESPTYLVVSPERIELRRWSGGQGESAEGDLLDSVDRGAEEALSKA
ncbi:MAG: UDP-2,3-diacylglucosamine diphosphatase, partial [Gemmatimonadaceae bacterium]